MNRGLRVTLPKLQDFSILVYLCVLSGHNMENTLDKALIRVAFVFMVFLTLLQSKGRLRIRINGMTQWFASFCLFCIMSSIWAVYSRSQVFFYVNRLIQILALTVCIPMCIREESDVEKILGFVLISMVYTSLLLIVRTPVKSWGTERFGAAIGLNANTLGVRTAIASMVALYCIHRRPHKLLLSVLYIVIIAISFMSGSKKALVFIVLSFAAYEMLSLESGKPRKILFRIGIVIAGVALIYRLIMTNPYLYQILGRRWVRFIGSLSGTYNINDISFNERSYFIEQAKQVFAQHPILGIGLDNFKVYINRIGFSRMVYSHNNYWELLSCLGITGTLLYYAFHVYMLVTLWRMVLRGRTKLNVFAAVIMTLITVLDYAAVTYNNIYNAFILIVLFAYIKVQKNTGIQKNG